jgi:hypothetical protein
MPGMRRPVWDNLRRWNFKNVEALGQALDEYASFDDGTLLRRYGERGPEGDDEALENRREAIMCQNAEIDRRMVMLSATAPLYFRLLHAFYRGGLCYEANGWEQAARRCGLPHDRRVHKKRFEVVREWATEALFFCRPKPPRADT